MCFHIFIWASLSLFLELDFETSADSPFRKELRRGSAAPHRARHTRTSFVLVTGKATAMIKVRSCPNLIRVTLTRGKLSVSIHTAAAERAARRTLELTARRSSKTQGEK